MSCGPTDVRQAVSRSVADLSVTDSMAKALALHCRHESEVIRSQAARALADGGNAQVAAQLHSLLVDKHPQVRVDAMHALLRCARLDDACMIRASLIGDPEFDVKQAAVAALAALKDRGAVDLLCQLATDRCEEFISWDESSHDWDQWPDLQPFVIKALGSIGDDRCIESLLALRLDEPECESLVFDALLQLGVKGVTQVLSCLDDTDHGVRERAVRAISQARPELLSGHADKLLNDADPRLRVIGMNCPDVAPWLVREKVTDDPDVQVRLAGLVRLNLADSDNHRILQAALHDPAAAVRLRALELGLQCSAITMETLSDDERHCLCHDNRSELCLPAPVCRQLLGNSAETQPGLWLASVDEALERRVYAAKVLGLVPSAHALDVLAAGLTDKAHQVRVACMNVLLDWMQLSDEASMASDPAGAGESNASLHPQVLSILQRAISGELMMSLTANSHDDPAAQPIQWHNTSMTTGGVTATDLEAIEQAARRGSIDGAEDVRQSLRCLALMMCARLPDSQIERATLFALDDPADEVIETALRALYERYSHIDQSEQHVSGELIGMLMSMMGHERQGIRYWAAAVLLLMLDDKASTSTGLIATLMRDDDALCRSLAMQHANAEQLRQGLSDSSSIVRNAAIDSLLSNPGRVSLEAAIDILQEQHSDDTLRRLITRSPKAKAAIAERLLSSDMPDNALNTLLKALAAA